MVKAIVSSICINDVLCNKQVAMETGRSNFVCVRTEQKKRTNLFRAFRNLWSLVVF